MEARRTALDLAHGLGHERVLIVQQPEVGLRAVIAVHDTTFGPAIGGTRMRLYPSFDAAVEDALLLSRAMTSKATFAGMSCGGGKAVIAGNPLREKSPALLEAYGRAVDELGGRFQTGCDMGIDVADLKIIARRTRHLGHTPESAPFDASDLTAIGVVSAMRTVAERLGRKLADCSIVVQGVGEVGSRLAKRLAKEGANLLVADSEASRVADVARETGARAVATEEVYDIECDLFSPNAAGGGIDEALAGTLPTRAVVGAANNPLASHRAGEILAERGVLYAPDFVVNAGGLLSVLFERGDLDERQILVRVERIGSDLAALLDRAEKDQFPPFQVADRIVEERLAAARAAQPRR